MEKSKRKERTMNTVFYNVKDYGAAGDGKTKDTAAIQKGGRRGGAVFLPAGTCLCGTIYLRDNTGLELETGAVILGNPDKEDYNAPRFCPQNRQ